jgi:hypothetical protein
MAALEPQYEARVAAPERCHSESGAAVRYVYFIESGMISLVVDTQTARRSRSASRVAKASSAGVVAPGNEPSFHRGVVQISGNGFSPSGRELLEDTSAAACAAAWCISTALC